MFTFTCFLVINCDISFQLREVHKTNLVVMNFFSFCLSRKIFISTSNLNDNLVRYSIIGWKFFPFSTLNISCHTLLAYTISAEISADSPMWFPLYVKICFSLAAFQTLSLSLTFDILVIMCLGRGLFGFILFGTFWDSWSCMFVYFPI